MSDTAPRAVPSITVSEASPLIPTPVAEHAQDNAGLSGPGSTSPLHLPSIAPQRLRLSGFALTYTSDVDREQGTRDPEAERLSGAAPPPPGDRQREGESAAADKAWNRAFDEVQFDLKAEHNLEVHRLKKEIATLKNDLVDMDWGRDAVKRELGALKTELGALKTELGAVKTELDAVKNDLFDIQWQRNAAKKERDAAKKERDAVKKELETMMEMETMEMSAKREVTATTDDSVVRDKIVALGAEGDLFGLAVVYIDLWFGFALAMYHFVATFCGRAKS